MRVSALLPTDLRRTIAFPQEFSRNILGLARNAYNAVVVTMGKKAIIFLTNRLPLRSKHSKRILRSHFAVRCQTSRLVRSRYFIRLSVYLSKPGRKRDDPRVNCHKLEWSNVRLRRRSHIPNKILLNRPSVATTPTGRTRYRHPPGCFNTEIRKRGVGKIKCWRSEAPSMRQAHVRLCYALAAI